MCNPINQTFEPLTIIPRPVLLFFPGSIIDLPSTLGRI